VPFNCPACGKTNEGERTCVRCGCELGGLLDIIAAAEAARRQGEASLARGDAAAAIRQAGISWQLMHSVAAARLAVLAHLAAGKQAEAAAWYAHAVEQSAHREE